MGLSQSNHRLLGGTKSSLSTTFTPCLIGGARRTPLTPEEREEYNRRRRDRYAKMTPEQKKDRSKKQKKRRAKMTPEQREASNRKIRKRRAKMTPEQRKERNRYERERRAKIKRNKAVDELLAFVETQANVDATGPDLLEADIDELLVQENFRLMEEDELLKILDENGL